MKLKTPKFPSKQADPAPPHPSSIISSAPYPAGQGGAVPVPVVTQSSASAPVTPASPLRKAAGGLTAPARRRNAAVMIAGAALIILAGALGASVAASFDDSLEVLVAAEPISEGQHITADHFRTVKIAAGAGDIQAVAPDSAEDLIGRVAAGPIGEGAMIHPSQFAIAADETLVVVGAALEPNQYPASGLKPGDQVRLIEVGARFGPATDEFSSGTELAVGEITDVVALSQERLHFSIRVPESSANVVAQRVSEGRLSLALVDQSITLERVEPLTPASPVVPLELDDEVGE